jgi:DNA-binding transcriptional LysR family regulator
MPKKNPLSQVSDFNLRLLRLFKTVVECGRFSAAESILGISRSPISLHMSDLEKRLGMRLCQRGRAGFALTDEGREILRASETVLAAIEGFRSEVNEMHQQLHGDLNIGIVNNLVTQPRMLITVLSRRFAPKVQGSRSTSV